MAVSIIMQSPADVAARPDEVVTAYLDIYPLPIEAGPPFATGLLERAARDGFALCAARDDTDGRLVGFAYGFTGLPGQSWRDAMAGALGPEVTAEWLDHHFEFAEFGVTRGFRRQGLGARLHDALLAAVPHRRAVLTVRAGQQPARSFYERRGWHQLHRAFYAPSGRGPYCIMGRELPLDCCRA